MVGGVEDGGGGVGEELGGGVGVLECTVGEELGGGGGGGLAGVSPMLLRMLSNCEFG